MTAPDSLVVRDAVGVHIDSAVATITLNRPERLNAVDAPTRRMMLDAVLAAEADPGVRAIVLTGAGRAFCVGQDLAATEELEDAHATVADSYNPLVRAIVAASTPVVAAVNGLAVGAGFGFALACDLRLASASATFAASFSKVGLVPDSSVSWFLVRELGYARAFELATTGRALSAQEALDAGLLNEVVPDDELAARAQQVAAALARGPALAFTLTKRIFRAVAQESFGAVAELEALSQGRAAASAEHVEGRSAFSERRAPQYPGAPTTVEDPA
jgi:2-(1,2-epoxy-1,2-dihydrophenyl)acetyl-CoA isomerase